MIGRGPESLSRGTKFVGPPQASQPGKNLGLPELRPGKVKGVCDYLRGVPEPR